MHRLGHMLALVVLSVATAASCKRGGDDEPNAGVDAGTFDKAALLRAWAECALGGYREFSAASIELETAARSAEEGGTPAARDSAREKWKTAIDAWERAELFGFGPAAPTTSPGGMELRDAIYAWPLVNRCIIETQIADKTYDTPAFSSGLVSGRSLSAAEYALFYEPADNACAPSSPLNSGGTWNALGAAEIGKRKAGYARAIAADTRLRAQALVAAWDGTQGHFFDDFVNAGRSSTFASEPMAFNAVSNAIFYIDDVMKDMKVGRPAGITPGCTAPPCVADVESPWAKRSKEHLKNNMIGFERLMRGCGPAAQGLGWDDLLTALGPQGQALASKLETGIGDANAALAALTEPSFEDDLQRNPAGVKRLYDMFRNLAVLLKTEFLSLLDLELPKRVEGDND